MSISSPLMSGNERTAPKAPDAFVCPKCHTNQAVFIDRDRNLRSGMASSLFQFLFLHEVRQEILEELVRRS